MVTLQLEHPVTDLPTWRAAFDRFAERRRQGGVRAERVGYPVDDDHFADVVRTTVWASRESSPALAGTRRTRIVEPLPEH